MKLIDQNHYVRFWLASTVSNFGIYITTLAIQVLVVVNMQGNAVDGGWVNAARWLPYIVLGLIAGVLLDRFSRKSVIVLTDLGRGFILASICFLVVWGDISIVSLIAMMI